MPPEQSISEIEQQIQRVIGAAGVDVTPEAPGGSNGSQLVVIETARAKWRMKASDLNHVLHDLPDRAGVEAFREACEHSGRCVPS